MNVIEVAQVALIGAGATALMDLWLALQKRVGVRTQDFAMVGRWIGRMPHGEFVHAAIAKAHPVRAERALGWLTHYAIGIAYAALLLAIVGGAWMRDPTWRPAVAFGIATVAAPLFVMQPAMGAGIAGSRSPSPWKGRLRSLVNHTVFGAGLYIAAAVVDALVRLVSTP